MTPTYSAAKARNWHVAVATCVALAALAQVWGSVQVANPLRAVPLPFRTVACLAIAVAATAPLATRWADFPGMLVRDRTLAPLRPLLAYVLFLTTALVASLGGAELELIQGHLVFVVALLFAALVRERWWLPTVVFDIALMALGGYQWYWSWLVWLNYPGAVLLTLVAVTARVVMAAREQRRWDR